jgi:hypothetical protein
MIDIIADGGNTQEQVASNGDRYRTIDQHCDCSNDRSFRTEYGNERVNSRLHWIEILVNRFISLDEVFVFKELEVPAENVKTEAW